MAAALAVEITDRLRPVDAIDAGAMCEDGTCCATARFVLAIEDSAN